MRAFVERPSNSDGCVHFSGGSGPSSNGKLTVNAQLALVVDRGLVLHRRGRPDAYVGMDETTRYAG